MSYKVHLKDREFVSLIKENTGSIGVSSEGMNNLQEYGIYETREDQLKNYLRKQIQSCRSSALREVLKHILFEIEYIDTHQDEITKTFSRFFTWIIAENQASNKLLEMHDPLKWVDLRRMKRERLRRKQQINLFERSERNGQKEQESVEGTDHRVRVSGVGQCHQGAEKGLKGRLQYLPLNEKSGSGTGIPRRSAHSKPPLL